VQEQHLVAHQLAFRYQSSKSQRRLKVHPHSANFCPYIQRPLPRRATRCLSAHHNLHVWADASWGQF